MTYEYLWTLFQPAGTFFSRPNGQEAVMTPIKARYGQNSSSGPCFWLTCMYVDWDSPKFGSSEINLAIQAYTGTRPTRSLRAYSLEFHPEGDVIGMRLRERGETVEALAGSNFRAYQGVAWRQRQSETKNQYNVNCRVSKENKTETSTNLLRVGVF